MLGQCKRLFIDTAPLVYFVEQHPHYAQRVTPIFQALDAGTIAAVTSPITLAEALVQPYRQQQEAVQQAFINTITNGTHTHFMAIDDRISRRAAQLRSSYNLSLLDALQVAVALAAGCDMLLTNDYGVRRVREITVVIVDELEL
ncbi:MAG: type II toxin-antitoxin system VapC family toxin [Chloroflexaceae bacterium]|nr:type II toxin-antitoxin system VapC family toxin [Chloroflexaceae bacterium]